MLDGPLLFAWGRRMSQAVGGQRVDEKVVIADFEARAPLARVEGADGMWWWACSQLTPWGAEQRIHLHRRAPLPQIHKWTQARSVNLAVGGDKSLRLPHYTRPEMLDAVWTCIGEPTEIRALLNLIENVGKFAARGAGAVLDWTVEPDPEGPTLSAYASDPTLRHIPAGAVSWEAIERANALGFTQTSEHALRAPYWMRESERTTRCFQIASLGDL
jgi:hypothetical protein